MLLFCTYIIKLLQTSILKHGMKDPYTLLHILKVDDSLFLCTSFLIHCIKIGMYIEHYQLVQTLQLTFLNDYEATGSRALGIFIKSESHYINV